VPFDARYRINNYLRCHLLSPEKGIFDPGLPRKIGFSVAIKWQRACLALGKT